MKTSDFNSHLVRYVIGFGSALCLSVLAYLVATGAGFSAVVTMLILLVLAALQLVIQLVCFLHLNLNDRSRPRTVTLAFTVLMMMIVVTGSLWIMKNLDYRMGMSGDAMNEYMEAQNKKGF